MTENVAETCRTGGISRTRFYKWRERAEGYGVEALTSPPDRATPRRGRGAIWRSGSGASPPPGASPAVLWLDTLLIGGLVSTRQAGIYAAATRYITAGLFAGAAIQQVIGPKISEVLARRDRPRAAALYQISTAWLMLAAWPVYLSLATFAPVLLGIFGHEFVTGQDVLVNLALTMLVASGVGAVDVVLLMGGKSIWNLANTVTSLSLNLALILRLHPFGSATLGGSIRTLILYEVVAGALYLLLLIRFRVPLQLAAFGQALRRR